MRWRASAGAAWLQMSHTAGTLRPGESTTITVYIDHDREPAGHWRARIAIEPGGTAVTLKGHGTTGPAPARSARRPPPSRSRPAPLAPGADTHPDPDDPDAHPHVSDAEPEADRPRPVLDTVEHDASRPLSAPGARHAAHRSHAAPDVPPAPASAASPYVRYFCFSGFPGFSGFFGGAGSAGCGAIGSGRRQPLLAQLGELGVALLAHQLDQLRPVGRVDRLARAVRGGRRGAPPVQVMAAGPPAAPVVLADRHLQHLRVVRPVDPVVGAPDRQLPADVRLGLQRLAALAQRQHVQRAARAGGEAGAVVEDARALPAPGLPLAVLVLLGPARLGADVVELPQRRASAVPRARRPASRRPRRRSARPACSSRRPPGRPGCPGSRCRRCRSSARSARSGRSGRPAPRRPGPGTRPRRGRSRARPRRPGPRRGPRPRSRLGAPLFVLLSAFSCFAFFVLPRPQRKRVAGAPRRGVRGAQ